MYYLCGENKGADQLRGYREADLRLCFRICRLLVSPQVGSNYLRNGFKTGEHGDIHDIVMGCNETGLCGHILCFQQVSFWHLLYILQSKNKK